MTNVEGKSATGEVISLDDKNFINCRLTNCTLWYSGADFAMANTKLANCSVTLSGAAQRTASLLGLLGVLKAGAGGLNPPPPIQ
jgi:uncharacterized protein YjbI with pentapeptide repeats